MRTDNYQIRKTIRIDEIQDKKLNEIIKRKKLSSVTEALRIAIDHLYDGMKDE